LIDKESGKLTVCEADHDNNRTASSVMP